jgi:hypothetical protein
MHVGRRRQYRMDDLCSAIDADVCLKPEELLLALGVRCICGSRLPSSFFIELGAPIIVASTIVPLAILMPPQRKGRSRPSAEDCPTCCAPADAETCTRWSQQGNFDPQVDADGGAHRHRVVQRLFDYRVG